MPSPSPVTATPLSPQTYKEEVWKHLVEREDFSNRIHSDPAGIPSMGVGYALAVEVPDPHAPKDPKNPKKSATKYVLRDLQKIGSAISGDPEHPYIFSKSEKQRLDKAIEFLNNHDMIPEMKIAELEKNIPPWRGDFKKTNTIISDLNLLRTARASSSRRYGPITRD